MTHPLHPSASPRRLRGGVLAVLAIAATTLLGGCAYWPTALSFQSEPMPVQAQPVPVTTEPANSASAPSTVAAAVVAPVPLEPKPTAVAVSAVVEPIKTPAPEKIVPATVAPTPPVAAAPHTEPGAALVPGYYINAGLYAVPGNASGAYQKLERADLPVFTQVVMRKQGPLTRVRVGPFSTRAQADAAVKKVRALKLDANVFRV